MNGTLNLLGNSNHPIVFTSERAYDTYGAHSNGDITATLPARGDWGYIYFNTGITQTLHHAVFRYGGRRTDGNYN